MSDPIAEAAATAAEVIKSASALPSVTLSDGRVATYVRRALALDVSKSHRIAGTKGTDVDRNAALMAQIVTLDGQPRTMEDFLKLDLDDFNDIAEAMPGKKSPGPAMES